MKSNTGSISSSGSTSAQCQLHLPKHVCPNCSTIARCESKKEEKDLSSYSSQVPLRYPYAGVLEAMGQYPGSEINYLGVPTTLCSTLTGTVANIGNIDLEFTALRLFLLASVRKISTVVTAEDCIRDAYNATLDLIRVHRNHCDTGMSRAELFGYMFANHDKLQLSRTKELFDLLMMVNDNGRQCVYVVDTASLATESSLPELKWRHPFLPVVSIARPMNTEDITKLLTGFEYEELKKKVITRDLSVYIVRASFDNPFSKAACEALVKKHRYVTDEDRLQVWNRHSKNFTSRCHDCNALVQLGGPETWSCYCPEDKYCIEPDKMVIVCTKCYLKLGL